MDGYVTSVRVANKADKKEKQPLVHWAKVEEPLASSLSSLRANMRGTPYHVFRRNSGDFDFRPLEWNARMQEC